MGKNRKYKGEYGSTLYRKKIAMIRTVFFLALCFGIFITGYVMYGSNRNVFSIIAALGCLPAGWSAVNLVMIMKAVVCSEQAHEAIERSKGSLLVYYELEMTSYERSYHIAAATVLERNVCCYSEDKKMIPAECEKHIREQLSLGGYSDHTVSVFTDLDRFTDRLEQLEKLRQTRNIDPQAIEDSWIPGTRQTPMGILLSISL